MFNYASLSFPNLYSTSLLARPRARNLYADYDAWSLGDHGAAGDDDEPVQPPESQREAFRYFEAARSGDESGAKDALNKIVEINRGAHNAAGVEVWAHPPLPRRFAAALAEQIGKLSEQQQEIALTNLLDKFEPSVRTLAGHQLSAQPALDTRLRDADMQSRLGALGHGLQALETGYPPSVSLLRRGSDLNADGGATQPLAYRGGPSASNTRQTQTDDQFWSDLVDCAYECGNEQWGFEDIFEGVNTIVTGIGGAAAAAGLIPSPYPRGSIRGSSGQSSVASDFFSRRFPQRTRSTWAPTWRIRAHGARSWEGSSAVGFPLSAA